MTRRRFTAVAASTLPVIASAAGPIPIIDTHIHLFDTRRPQGVPWPPKDDALLYQPALPARYQQLVRPLGVVGAIEVEASPWLEDNEWVLGLAAGNTILVGTVGDLEPGKPEFPKQLEHFHKDPLFRGIRYGNLWGRSLAARISEQVFIDHLRLLVEAGLVLDTANPDPPLMHTIVRLSDKLPDLRIVLDHVPNLELPAEVSARTACERDLRNLGERPQVFVKVSQVLQAKNRHAALDRCWDTFGEDRLLFASDWPNSDPFGTYEQVVSAMRPFFESKGHAAAEKYFWKNSIAAYRWIRRAPSQPAL